MGLSLRGTTSGAVDINAPAVAGDNTITLPGNNGAANQFYKNSGTAGIVTHSSMVEDSSSNIGIGLTNPDAKLQVNGNAVIGTDNVGLVEFTSTGIPYFAVAADANNYRSTRINVVSSGGYADLSFDTIGTASKAGLPSAGSLVANIMYLDASTQRVGIGTDNPAQKLEVNGNIQVGDTPTSAVRIDFGSASSRIQYGGDDNISTWTNGSERLRVDSAGRLLVGISSTRGKFFSAIDTKVQIEGGTTPNCSLSITRNDATGDSSKLVLAHARGTEYQILLDDDAIGDISWQGADGNKFLQAATIRAFVDNTPGVDDMPGRLEFSTTADGASNPTLRMRINSAGRIDMNAGYISFGSVGMKTRTASSGTGASIFFSAFGTNVSQTGFIHAVEIGTTNYLILACYKKDSSSGVATTLIANNGLTVLATNAGGTVTLTGFTNTNNVRMIAVINQTQYA